VTTAEAGDAAGPGAGSSGRGAPGGTVASARATGGGPGSSGGFGVAATGCLAGVAATGCTSGTEFGVTGGALGGGALGVGMFAGAAAMDDDKGAGF